MIAVLVLLAVAAGAGWSLAIALLTGRAIVLADRRPAPVVEAPPAPLPRRRWRAAR